MKKYNKPPFSKDYVLSVTLGHMKRCIDVSLDKVVARLPEFENSEHSSKEVFETLSELKRIKASLETYESQKLENKV